MLPISNYKSEIITAVQSHAFTIVTAETGSGKSTQIPQYLADYYQQVIVTEPRIMAAKTLAKRVSEEMGVELGKEVGYKTGYDKCSSPNSKILFCTDGLQLIRTILSSDTKQENVLIIDEAHEWNLNIETLIAWCKFMKENWNTKVVVMSATMDTAALANYFGEDVAILSVPGQNYDVSVEEKSEGYLISTILEKISEGKNILVFVAGKKEIYGVMEHLNNVNAVVLPLHGEMDWDEQKKCFERYDCPKVIVATNVAQTSLTIPDIDVVIDTGKAKISIAEDGIQGLFLKDISKADILQRKGRAGRTKNGEYILCSYTKIEWREDYTLPEIQRSILDRVVLQLASIGLDAERLSFFHQPNISEIQNAKKELRNLGAFDENNEVTEIGYKMVKMPVSVQLARMIIEAEKHGVTESVITIAAIIEMGGLLSKEGNYRQFTNENTSDLLAELDVWKEINQMDWIDFEGLGIKKKNFFKIKEHIQKLHEALDGVVDMTDADDREAILKSCLSGLVSHIYISSSTWGSRIEFEGIEECSLKLDKKSCVGVYTSGVIVVGKPKKIEFQDRYGLRMSMTLVSFASKIDADTLLEISPNSVQKETNLSYSAGDDAVVVLTRLFFAGHNIKDEIHIEKNHPDYNRLKEEYEEKQRLIRRQNEEYMGIGYNTHRYEEYRQSTILFNQKEYDVHYWGSSTGRKPCICIGDEELYSSKEDVQLFLDDGRKVYFMYNGITQIYIRESIESLKSAVEYDRIQSIRKQKKYLYSNINVATIEAALKNQSKLGKMVLTTKNGGYSNEPILAYVCLLKRGSAVSFEIVNDEETANLNTDEAIKYLFRQEVETKYSDGKFSHQKGKKKKILTDEEKKVKEEFYSLVRECMSDVSIKNASEYLVLLEEYYQELMH